MSGESLDAFFELRVFDFLGMVDTIFEVPSAELDRLAADCAGGPDGGLVSTMHDSLPFARMLLDGGGLDGTRFSRQKPASLRTQSQLDGSFEPRWGFGSGCGCI